MTPKLNAPGLIDRFAARRFVGRSVARLLAAHALAFALAGGLLACSNGNGDTPPPASCPYVTPECPDSGSPSFMTDVQPIIEERCYGCHTPGGVGYSTQSLTSYASVAQADLIGVLGACTMPPPDAGQLTLEQRTTIFDWIACSKPNN